jgi:hypothetical protein
MRHPQTPGIGITGAQYSPLGDGAFESADSKEQPADAASASRPVAPSSDITPVAWRVYWEHHGAKLTGSKPIPEFRDFNSKAEAEQFKRCEKERFPYSAFCMMPIYTTSRRKVRDRRRASGKIRPLDPPRA